VSQLVRLSDIAAKIGVSTVTVSKALNGKPGVGSEMRGKIRLLARDMGYEKHIPVKPRKSARTTGNIGILVPARFLILGNDSFYWGLYRAVLSYLNERNYFGIMEVTRDEEEKQLVMPRILRENKTDGIILMGQFGENYINELGKNNIPLVFLDSYNGKSGKSSVISDGYYGMYAVVSYLIGMGHRDICFVGKVGATSSISDRFFGYCRAMAEYGFPVTDDMVISDRNELGEMDIALPEIMPTAFACNCDLAAYELISKLNEKNILVPDDVSVAGFDDFISFKGLAPHLKITTYFADTDAMARVSVEELITKIEDPKYSPTLKIITGTLIIRDSVKTPSNSLYQSQSQSQSYRRAAAY